MGTCYYCRSEIDTMATICPHCRSHVLPGGAPIPPGGSGGPVLDTIGWILVWSTVIYVIGGFMGFWGPEYIHYKVN